MNTNSEIDTVIGDGIDKSLISEEPKRPVRIKNFKRVKLEHNNSEYLNVDAHTVELIDENNLKVSTQTHGTSSLR